MKPDIESIMKKWLVSTYGEKIRIVAGPDDGTPDHGPIVVATPDLSPSVTKVDDIDIDRDTNKVMMCIWGGHDPLVRKIFPIVDVHKAVISKTKIIQDIDINDPKMFDLVKQHFSNWFNIEPK